MSEFNYQNNQLHLENCNLSDIAKQVGTPVYVYSKKQILDNFNAYKESFDQYLSDTSYTICYACKANSNLHVLKIMADAGAGADIVSGGELTRVLRAGIPANKVVYSGVGKSRSELEQALKAGIFQINVESKEELSDLSNIASEIGINASVALRVNPDVDAKTHEKITTGKKENKFGIEFDNAYDTYQHAVSLPAITPVGLTMHIGSQLTDLAPFKNAFLRMAELVTDLRDAGCTVDHIDLGGGIGVIYEDSDKPVSIAEYTKLVQEIIAPLGCHIIIEPGRSITGNAGALLTDVMYVKKGNSRQFAILNAAMNDLARPALYDAYHPIWPCHKSEQGNLEKYDIVGPVCETGDRFSLNEDMQPLKSGDLLALMVSGAYGAVMSSTYNTRPLVPEVLVDGNEWKIIRRKWDVEDMLALENFD